MEKKNMTIKITKIFILSLFALLFFFNNEPTQLIAGTEDILGKSTLTCPL